MRRYGPLIALPGALAVGDPGRWHLRLTADAVAHREGAEHRDRFAWEQISLLHVDVPTTRFRYPGMLGTVALSILTAVTGENLGIDPDDGATDVVVDGEPRRLPLSRHHVGGYWLRTVTGAQRLLDHLLVNPQQRSLLSRPESLVELAARLARTGRL
ncbi:hypothetical protein [Microbacterium sp.]|uniref:hypothetical protein n=1 Tax=Microbacterium sp. TaxID=51671 RepID=UPI002810C9EE|nr:hypothetical protein [Microbacterium sp.]